MLPSSIHEVSFTPYRINKALKLMAMYGVMRLCFTPYRINKALKPQTGVLAELNVWLYAVNSTQNASESQTRSV